MGTPDLVSITDKGLAGGCSLGGKPDELSHEANMGDCVLYLLSPQTHSPAGSPLPWEEGRRLCVDILITLI